jgi:hypothetical protein
MMGYATIVKKLYCGSTELQAKDKYGKTAPMYAEMYGRKAVVTFLYGQSALTMITLLDYVTDTSAGASLITQDLVKVEPEPAAKALVCDHESSPFQTSDTVTPLGEGAMETETSDPPMPESLQTNTRGSTPLYTGILICANLLSTSGPEEDILQIGKVCDDGEDLSGLT